MLTIFYNFLRKILVVKVVFEDRANVRNDFLYNMEGTRDFLFKKREKLKRTRTRGDADYRLPFVALLCYPLSSFC